MMPNPQIRTVTRNRSRRRRLPACQRHPGESATGLCAGLDSSSGQVEVEKVVVSCRRTRSSAPEFRRSKSVVAERCEGLNDLDSDQRRKSCDVRARSSLSDLFVVDDTKKTRDGESRSESMYSGFSTIAEPVVETNEDEDDDEIRVSEDISDEIRGFSDDLITQNEDDDDEIRGSDAVGNEIRVFSDDVITRNEDDDDDEFEQGDLKTMKEIIELELLSKRRNFWDAASVFSQKLRKWRQKQKQKKQNRCINGGTDVDRSKLGQFSQIDNQSVVEEYKLGRRSCDTEPRFSTDGHRLSVEDPRFSFDEHRASWDGYMVARTIPRLTPMLSVVDNMMLTPVNRTVTIMEKQQMHSIHEDGSAPSVSDCFTSNVGSSSSSSTKTLGLSGDDVKSSSNARVSPANDVMVVTEKELKDWHLNSTKNNDIESVSNAPDSSGEKTVTNPTSRWKKVCNLWGHKHKVGDKNGDKTNVEDIRENRHMNVVRNNGFVSLRKRSTRYSTSDVDSGLLRLYLTPFRNSRRYKHGKSRGPSMVFN